MQNDNLEFKIVLGKEGKVFEEAGIPHIKMYKVLKR